MCTFSACILEKNGIPKAHLHIYDGTRVHHFLCVCVNLHIFAGRFAATTLYFVLKYVQCIKAICVVQTFDIALQFECCWMQTCASIFLIQRSLSTSLSCDDIVTVSNSFWNFIHNKILLSHRPRTLHAKWKTTYLCMNIRVISNLSNRNGFTCDRCYNANLGSFRSHARFALCNHFRWKSAQYAEWV